MATKPVVVVSTAGPSDIASERKPIRAQHEGSSQNSNNSRSRTPSREPPRLENCEHAATPIANDGKMMWQIVNAN
jgi:hypothetical protein